MRWPRPAPPPAWIRASAALSALRWRRAGKLAERQRGNRGGRLTRRNLVVEPAQFIGGVFPAVGLAFYEPLEQSDRRCRVRGPFVLHRARDRRHAIELDRVGEE